VAGSTPSGLWPSANAADSGTQMASAARIISGHGTGAGRGLTTSASQPGTTAALRGRAAAVLLIASRRTGFIF
jgi:hypothetical protein